MQFAERSRAIGSIVVCFVATAALAVVIGRFAHHRWRHHHGHHHSQVFDLPRCHERIEPPPPVEPPPAPPVAATYDGVLATARPLFAPCFAHDGHATELLVTIAPDGRVRATTSRPEPETHTSQCLANVVRGLVFPPAPTTVMMRVPLAPSR